eukprot:TRINITY_DN124418_c0_g1_i1.p1 TRINITY_DN124418_c0_g1~~TRINITY_DN124418_c0_g1_i1.p1  ORF type:complete len:467 (-),score=73.74 TRINITY_DN124418_c0_g1_i1:345-1643(-)
MMLRRLCSQRCLVALVLGSGSWFRAAAVADSGEAALGEPVLPDGTRVPDDEGGAMGVLGDWLDRQQWSEAWRHGDGQHLALKELKRLATLVPTSPGLAIAVGQNVYSYFWWAGGQASSLAVPDLEAGELAARLHLHAVKVAQCDQPALPRDAWTSLQCAFRWRYTLMIMVEIGVAMAWLKTSPAAAASMLRQATAVLQTMKALPQFRRQSAFWVSPYDVNTNSEYFPGPVNRPVWPTASVPLAVFLEQHAAVFMEELGALLDSGNYEGLYWGGEVSLSQFAPRLDDWMPITLVKNRRRLDKACAMAPRSCALLESRSEIMRCSASDAGAAFARLRGGSALKPHLWNTPRLGVHLGLRVPPGASMRVGPSTVTWQEGKAVVFDDTYVHSVRHYGSETRYVLVAWFCHPCDKELADEPPPPEAREPLCDVQLQD